MASKSVLVLITILCTLQGIQLQSSKPMLPLDDPLIDEGLRLTLFEIQVRMSQIASLSKTTIGQTIAAGSKTIKSHSSQIKTNIKHIISSQNKDASVIKLCINNKKIALEQLDQSVKLNISTCSQNSSVELYTLNLLQKEVASRISALSKESNGIVKICKIENPLEVETEVLQGCIKIKSDGIVSKIDNLELEMSGSLLSIKNTIQHLEEEVKSCGQTLEKFVQEKTKEIDEIFKLCINQ